MASRRSKGVAGSAVLAGAAGLYLVYIGIKDVEFMGGLQDLLNQRAPTPRTTHNPYQAKTISNVQAGVGTLLGIGKNDTGIDRLKGNAIGGYNAIRAAGDWQILGWGLRPDLSSDHPKGLALDVMTKSDSDAKRIIGIFRSLPGAKYWIWNRQIANVAVDNWRVRPYTGASPHTDHVHLSFS